MLTSCFDTPTRGSSTSVPVFLEVCDSADRLEAGHFRAAGVSVVSRRSWPRM